MESQEYAIFSYNITFQAWISYYGINPSNKIIHQNDILYKEWREQERLG